MSLGKGRAMEYYSLPSAETLNTLEACVKVEECCGEIYRYFASLFRDNAKIAALWREMAEDEDAHADKFRLAVATHGCSPECLADDNHLIAAIIEKLDDLIVKMKNNPPQLRDAFLTAAILEHSIEKYHVATCSLLVNEELKALLSEMAHSDQCHRMMLESMTL